MNALMRDRWRRVTLRRFLGGVTCLVAAVVMAQELPQILETVEVRVVNVDVVVSDGEGRPVRGLESEDFELLVNGRPAAFDYFSSVVDGSTAGTRAEAAGSATLPYLAIVYDGRGMRPASARRAVDTLSFRLDGLLANTRSVMVLRQGTSLVVAQPMTRDRERLTDALERLAEQRTPALDAADRQLLLLQLQNTNPPQVAGDTEDELAAQQAQLLLRQIRIQAEVERFAAEESSRQLLIKVPMARLSLLPQRAHHIGRLSFVVMAQAADGGLSRPATGEVPIEIANTELLSAMGRMAGYRLQLRTSGGEQIVAIGVRDEVARQDATLLLVLTPGWDA